MFWTGETYFALGVCLLRVCTQTQAQTDLSHSESVFFIPGLQYIHFGVFLLALGWGNSVVKARRERKEGNYALTLGSRGLRSWNWRRRRFWGFHISRPSHTGSSSALQVKKDAFGRPYAPTCEILKLIVSVKHRLTSVTLLWQSAKCQIGTKSNIVQSQTLCISCPTYEKYPGRFTLEENVSFFYLELSASQPSSPLSPSYSSTTTTSTSSWAARTTSTTSSPLFHSAHPSTPANCGHQSTRLRRCWHNGNDGKIRRLLLAWEGVVRILKLWKSWQTAPLARSTSSSPT